MAIPKKGTRKIVVDRIIYRYKGFATHMEGDDYGDLVVSKEDGKGQKIKAQFTWTKLHEAYKKVGHALSHAADHMPPYVVRQTILYGLKNHWDPEKGSGMLDLGNLDEKLNFNELKIESQNTGQ